MTAYSSFPLCWAEEWFLKNGHWWHLFSPAWAVLTMVLAGRVGFKWGLSLNVPLDVQACCCNLYSIVTAGDLNTLPPWLVNCNQEWVLITFQQRLLVFSYSSVSSLAQLSAGNRVLSEPPAAVSKHVTQRLCNWFFLFHWVWEWDKWSNTSSEFRHFSNHLI